MKVHPDDNILLIKGKMALEFDTHLVAICFFFSCHLLDSYSGLELVRFFRGGGSSCPD
jgi:hypothetical protein